MYRIIVRHLQMLPQAFCAHQDRSVLLDPGPVTHRRICLCRFAASGAMMVMMVQNSSHSLLGKASSSPTLMLLTCASNHPLSLVEYDCGRRTREQSYARSGSVNKFTHQSLI
ncbi:hypothetical protein Mapa_005892 [Marchantia paleacea]|nr:hypothetical protein Mapa_005892 [Marchantia paleacea]